MKSAFFFLSIVLLMSNPSFGQERKQVEKPKISKSIIGQLKSAKGWILNPNKEWLSQSNTIPAYRSSLSKYGKFSLGLDNFKSYELREMTYKGEGYYILIKKYNTEQYKYAYSEVGWYKSWNKYLAYVFKKTDWEKVLAIEDNKINLVEINLEAVIYLSPGNLSQKKAYSQIESQIEWADKSDNIRSLILHIAPYKEKNIVQFQIYANHKYKYGNFFSGILNEHEVDNEKQRGKKQIYLTDELFSHCYFETNYKKFNKFINLE